MRQRLRLLVLLGAALAVSASSAYAQATYTERTDRLDAASECVLLDVRGMGTGVWQVTGSFVGTVSFTIAGNDGDYVAASAVAPGSSESVSSVTDSTGAFRGDVSGMRFMRACLTSYTSGIANVTVAASLSGGAASTTSSGGSVTQPGEGSEFSTGTAAMLAGAVRRDTPGPGTGVADGDVGVPCMSQFGGWCVQLLTDTGEVATFATDAQHGQSVPTTGPMGFREAKSFDGAALPNTVTEGQAIRAAATPSGVSYTIATSQDGSVDRLAGCTPGSSLSGAAVLETEVKSTPGTLCTFSVQHIDATPVICRLYNDTAANTDESDTPVQRFLIPANATASLGSGSASLISAPGLNFSTAITFRCTSGLADNSTGALSATEVAVSYSYK